MNKPSSPTVERVLAMHAFLRFEFAYEIWHSTRGIDASLFDLIATQCAADI